MGRGCAMGVAFLAFAGCGPALDLDDVATPLDAPSFDGGSDAGGPRDGGRDAAAADGGPDAAPDAARDAPSGVDAPTPCGEPEIAGTVAVRSLAARLDADRGFAHAVLTRTGIATIDATSPAAMRVVAELPFDQPRAVTASRNFAVVLAEAPGAFPILPVLHGYDVRDPARPVELFLDYDVVYADVVLVGTELVVTSGFDIATLEVSSFGAYRRGGLVLTGGGGESYLARDGDRVVFARGRAVDVVDVSSFEVPRALAHADVSDDVRGVAIAGDRVYVAATSVLEILAIEGSGLRLVASVPEGIVQNVARWRDRLVLARYSDVVIVEEAMPENVLAYFVPDPTGLTSGGIGLAIDGDTAFVGGDGLVTAIALCPPP